MPQHVLSRSTSVRRASCSHCALTLSCRWTARAFYDRKRAEGKRHNAAVICLARRRCDVILAMLRSRTPYQAEIPHDQPVAA